MVMADLNGAKASNAGDDFHVLWALHHALRVLDPTSELTAVTVEGLPAQDNAAAERGAWDGVDVALFYGGDSLASVSRVEIAQLKYSTASPSQSWTVSRLCQSTKRTGNSSVMARLAKAHAEVLRLTSTGSKPSIIVKLVSNQPVHQNVLKAIKAGLSQPASVQTKADKDAWDKMRASSGLTAPKFRQFAEALDFSDCEGPSRFSLQERVIEAIAKVAAADTRPAMLELRNAVYSRMLPDGDLSPITKAVILNAMYIGDEEALLPCPSQLKLIEKIVSRGAVHKILQLLSQPHQRICIHGSGGCGKTTALQEIGNELPPASEMIVFDCYGGGSYLDSDGQRHLPRHAFLHLCNELSARVGAPMLITASPNTDYVREFKSRLRRAASIVYARSDKALLVIAVDAADNSVTAAETRVPPEHSFIHDFVTLGDLPENVRLVISARTGRRETLRLSDSFESVHLENFTLPEMAQFVHFHWKNATEPWIEDMQYLSGGNPRVLSYAFEYAGSTPTRAIDYLRPSGKDLPLIFAARVKEAIRKSGDFVEFGKVCAGLVALPRPIPLCDLGAILGLSESRIRDLSSDFAPMLRDDKGYLGFNDEDFEAFIREHAQSALPEVRRSAADYFLSRHQSDSYAAEHLASALLDAGANTDLLQLAQDFPEPKTIQDPVHRREVQLHRLKLAMRVARQAGKKPDAILVLLRGAHALKTDAAVRSMLTKNIDLAAQFAQASLRKTVLFETGEIGLHGRALCQLMLGSALKGEKARARDYRRQFRAWLGTYMQRRKVNPRDKWVLDGSDLSAEGEAILRVSGPDECIDALRSWKPKTLMPDVILTIARRLLSSGDAAILEACLGRLTQRPLWDVFIRVPLALAGRPVDVAAIQHGLSRWFKRGWIKPEQLREDMWHNSATKLASIEWLLVAAELVVARTGSPAGVRQLLEMFADTSLRRTDKLHTSNYSLLDAALRAHTLLERSAGRSATVASFLCPPDPLPSEPVTAKEKSQKRHDDEKREELEKFVRHIIPVYDARAVYLLETLDRDKQFKVLEQAVESFGKHDYRLHDEHNLASMRDRVGESLASLLHVPIVDGVALAELSCKAANMRDGSMSARELNMLHLLCHSEAAHSVVITKTIAHFNALSAERAPATERADKLIDLARLLAVISPDDAESMFTQATAVLDDVDFDAVFGIEMLEPLVKKATQALDLQTRCVAACNTADLIEETWSYIGNSDNFPWESVVRTLTTLNCSVALAAVSRWEDAGIVERYQLLPELIAYGLGSKILDSGTVLPLLPLLEGIDTNILEPIEADLRRGGGHNTSAPIVEELSRLAVLYVDGENGLSEVRSVADMSSLEQSTPWLMRARAMIEFVDDAQMQDSIHHQDDQPISESVTEKEDTLRIRSALQLPQQRFVTVAAIRETASAIVAEARIQKSYISTSAVLEEMRRSVRPADRRAHIEALSLCMLNEVYGYEYAGAISSCVMDWKPTSPAVAQWCIDRLPSILIEHLPSFSSAILMWKSTLPQLLEVSGLPDITICETLLEGLEQHAHRWDARSVYEMLGLVAHYVSPAEASSVLNRHLRHQSSEISVDQVRFAASDMPKEVNTAIGRFLYSYLGDVDLRLRWSAAHGLRIAARLECHALIESAFAQWDRKVESSFRDPKAPFYWIAAKLWLLIAADRIALENPIVLKPHVPMLLSAALDTSFPHLLCCHFARETSETLVRAGVVKLRESEAVALARVNTPRLKAKARVAGTGREFRGWAARDETRRFHFDSTDTLPYWYSQPLGMFADVCGDEFLDKAEAWIVDKWQGSTEVWQWAKEPRQHRFSRNSLSTSHRHGSLPTLERAHTHLEWHAMWSVVGELLGSRPLVKTEEDSYGSWSYWSLRIGLTQPGYWLSDLRDTKPLVERLWFPQHMDSAKWLDAIDGDSLLAELGIDECADELIVASYVTTNESKKRATLNLSSALVSSETASALLRALQTIGNAWDYKIPDEGDDLEIDFLPFKLKGWLRHREGDDGLDRFDVLRREVSAISMTPGADVQKVLGIQSDPEDSMRWIDSSGIAQFRYIAWSDDMSDEASRRDLGSVRSYGYRLVATRSAIQKYLKAKDMDLIIEVEVTRRTKDSNDYDTDDSQEPTEAQYDRIIILRKDGTIEGAEGHIGSWTTSGQRAQSGRQRGHAGAVDGAPPRRTSGRGRKVS